VADTAILRICCRRHWTLSFGGARHSSAPRAPVSPHALGAAATTMQITCLFIKADLLGIRRMVCLAPHPAHWVGTLMMPFSTRSCASAAQDSQRNTATLQEWPPAAPAANELSNQSAAVSLRCHMKLAMDAIYRMLKGAAAVCMSCAAAQELQWLLQQSSCLSKP